MPGGGRGSMIVTGEAPGKPTGFIDAVSQIESYATLEEKGGEIPEGLFTTKLKIEFFEVGVISTLQTALVTILLVPLAIGVIEKHFPLFGGEGSWGIVDSILVLFVSCSFTIGYAVFLARLGMFYVYPYSKKMINAFLSGVWMGAFFKVIIALVLYHTLAFAVCKPESALRIVLKFHKWISYETEKALFELIVGMGEVFIISAWFIVGTTVVFLAVPFVSILITKYRHRKYMLQREKILGPHFGSEAEKNREKTLGGV